MQITANASAQSTALYTATASAASQSAAQDTAQPSKEKLAATQAPAANDASTGVSPSADTSGLRRLSAEEIAALDRQAANDTQGRPSTVVYAEIWKDGIKVGEVFNDGRTAYDTAAPNDAGGAISAQIRAQQMANEIGGEVRYPGQEAAKIERTRQQLRAAYGV